MRRLIIDCQILQTAAFDRGMGKYTLSLLAALGSNSDFKKLFPKVTLLLNKNLNVDKVRVAAIQKILPEAKLLVEDLPFNSDTDTERKYTAAKQKITQIVKEMMQDGQEVSYLITSPFFVSFPAVFPAQPSVKKYSIVYDLIPYKIWFKQHIFPDDLYFKHFEILLEADRLLTISQAVADDLHQLLWIEKEKAITIDGGPFEQPVIKKKAKLPTDQPYVIFISAPIFHKNNEKAIEGFERFNAKNGRKHKLVITSSFDEGNQEKLKKLSSDLIFTGNISDEDLVSYRQSADALLFASLAEGLGMPILEAVIDGIPVACSSIPVHREISENGLYFFNPNKSVDIALALEAAVLKKDWDIKVENYPEIKRKYTWKRSAVLATEALARAQDSKKTDKSVVIVSPEPQNGSAAGRLGELLYGSLADSYKVHWQSIGTNKKAKYPTYLHTIAAKAPKKANYKIIIGKPEDGASINADDEIIIKIRKQPFTLFPKKTSKELEIFATQYKPDESLGFVDWRFSVSKQSVKSEVVLDAIKDKLGN